MVKKELTNKKVVRAIALGLSAVMLTTPMTAHAETANVNREGNPTPEPKEEGTLQESDVADEAQAAVDNVTEVSDDASKSVADVNVAIDAAKDVLPESVIDAAPGTEPDLDTVDAKMDSVDGSLVTAEQSDSQVSSQKAAAEAAAQDATNAKAEAETIVSDAKTAVDDYTEDIQNATTIEAANKAYEDANKAVEDAKVAFAEKEAAYNDAKAAYAAAVQSATLAKATYEEAIQSAAGNAAVAKDIYDAALAEAETLKTALDKAQGELGTVSAEALLIADAESTAKAANNWTSKDDLFASMMKNYFIPQELNGNGTDAVVKRIQGKDAQGNNDHERNYFEVTYTDENGQTVTAYYNYKVNSGNIVIFEKRDKEVNGGEADQYVDENKKVVSLEELQAGLKDESIRDIDGTYYIEGDRIESASDVREEDSTSKEKEGTVTTITDVDVADITDAKPEYTVDEDGNIVKTVKADVTTTISTYVDKTWTDGVLYDSEGDAIAAGKDYVAGYTDAINAGVFLYDNDNGVTAEEVTVTEFTATGTYIPTFTTTVTVNEEVERNWDDWRASDCGEAKTEEEAIAIVEDIIRNNLDKENKYYISSTGLSAIPEAGKKQWDGPFEDYDFIVSGEVEVTYADIDTDSFNLNELQGILGEKYSELVTGKNKNNENLEAVIKSYLESQGAIFVSAEWGNGKGGNNSHNGNKATIRYVWRNEITTEKQNDAQAAESGVSVVASNDAAMNGATGAYNVKVTGTTSSEVTKYKYNLAYSERTDVDSNTDKGVVVLRETYEANMLTAQIVQNLNHLNKNYVLKQGEGSYRDFVDDNVNLDELNKTYEDLLAKVADAQTKVTDAQAKVVELQDAIDGMEGTDISDLAKELEAAEDALKDALEELATLDGELEEAKEVLDEVIVKLTPVPESGDDSDDGDDDDDTVAVVTPVVTPVVVDEAPVAPVAVATAPTGAGQAVVNIDDEATPLAGGIDGGNGNGNDDAGNGDDEVIVAEAQEETPAIVAIEDEETPLAAGVGADAKMSWWWLLIVALFGATGYKMYKDHQKKKEEGQEA